MAQGAKGRSRQLGPSGQSTNKTSFEHVKGTGGRLPAHDDDYLKYYAVGREARPDLNHLPRSSSVKSLVPLRFARV